ncbi:hypothetical protein BDV93DRAFT_293383 [Ceratobasidium sp. AG-I]|nr:hypothetical protein BDV93DRAFT_293383 [Ceratobasidium sp. AG-I]
MQNTYMPKPNPASMGHSHTHWFSTCPTVTQTARELSPIPYDLSTDQVYQIQLNESLEVALKRAPMTLRDCLKHQGEKGVLSWVNGFSELVDTVKRSRDNGDLFISNYHQAVSTCEILLQMRTEIKSQLIIICFFSHVRRLKRIFEPDSEKSDPGLDFPFFETGHIMGC